MSRNPQETQGTYVSPLLSALQNPVHLAPSLPTSALTRFPGSTLLLYLSPAPFGAG